MTPQAVSTSAPHKTIQRLPNAKSTSARIIRSFPQLLAVVPRSIAAITVFFVTTMNAMLKKLR
jgi:hypothetical protein